MPDSPESLVKFCTAGTAEQILSGRRLRWSAPHLLGDPFELDHQSELGFDPLTLLDGVIRAATGMIFSREPPRSNSSLATVVRRWREEERFASPEEAEEVLKELMSQVVDQRQHSIEEMMADWRKFTRELRLCCFSAKPDSLSCWQLFADRHRGLALRFRCGEYTSLEAPRAVEYSSNRPEITSFREQLNAILYQEKINAQARFAEKFLVKPPVCSEEQEWRCFFHATDMASSREPDDGLWYDDRPFEQSDLAAVYFGAFIPANQKQRIATLVRESYPDARLFQASPVPGRYEVEFSRLRRE